MKELDRSYSRAAFRRDLKILVVEDDDVIREMMRDFFRKLEIEADVAVNGLEALEYVFKNTYDLICMDLEMPKMNGIEATIEIRKTFKKSPLIVATTGNDPLVYERKCSDIGMNGFLAKPVRISTLVSILEQHFPLVVRQKV